MPYFFTGIATRNRPQLFRTALQFMLAQSWSNAEIIVVSDGSSTEHLPEYESILGTVGWYRVRSFALIPRPNGHGGSYARNFGAAEAKSPYLCFLDDDDSWTDPSHRNRAQAVIFDAAAPVDLYMANQASFLNGVQQPGPISIENLSPILAQHGNRPDSRVAHTVDLNELLRSRGFCHLNRLVIGRASCEEIGDYGGNHPLGTRPRPLPPAN